MERMVSGNELLLVGSTPLDTVSALPRILNDHLDAVAIAAKA